MEVLAPSVSEVPRINVLGVGISALNLETCCQLLSAAIKRKDRGYVCITGVHGVMEGQDDPRVRRILNQAFLCTPDGMPMVWMGKLGGHRQMGRVYGPDLMLQMCRVPGLRHFLYGGSDGTVLRLKAKLESRFPGVRIVGTYEPPWRPLSAAEAADLAEKVEQGQPDIFWVGLSTPKQEIFMAEYLPKLPVRLMIGVGAAFDMHSGRLRQAPRWMQQTGLEWCFRLWQEPRRLWRRYLRNNPRFVWAVACQILHLRRYPLA